MRGSNPNMVEAGIGLKDNLSKDLKKATSNLTRFKKKMIDGFKSVGKAVFSVKTLIGGLVAGYVVRGFARLITKVTQLDDQMQKLSQRLGVTTEFLSEIKFAGEQSGVGFDKLSIGIQRAIRRMEEFRATGKGEAASAIDALGIGHLVKSGAAFEEMLPRIAEGFKNLGSDAERVRVGFKLFDSEGVAMVQLLGQGADAMAKLRAEARRLGLTLSQEDADAAAEFNDALNRLGRTWNALTAHIVRAFVPVLTEIVDAFQKIVEEYRDPLVDFFKSIAHWVQSVDWAQVAQNIATFVDRLETAVRRTQTILRLFGGFSGSLLADALNAPGAPRDYWQGPPTPKGYIPPGQWGASQWRIASAAASGVGWPGGGWTPASTPSRGISGFKPRDANIPSAVAGQGAIASYSQGVTAATAQTKALQSALGGTENMLASLAVTAGDWKSAFRSATTSILADLARIAAKLLVVRALSVFGAFGGGVSAPAALGVSTGAATSTVAGPVGGIGGGIMTTNATSAYLSSMNLQKGGTPSVVIQNNINAIDAPSFDKHWEESFGKKAPAVAVQVVDQIKRKGMKV